MADKNSKIKFMGQTNSGPDTPPTKPIDLDVDPTDGLDRTPIFQWLSSVDLESDLLTYEMAIYSSATSGQIGSAMISGLDLPASYLSEMRTQGLESNYTLSTLSALSAFVTSSWLNSLNDGDYFVRVRAFDGINYSPWSDNLFFFVDAATDDPILTLVPKHGKIEIYWNNPPNSDFYKTVIIYSTLGFPSMPEEYLEGTLVEDFGAPGESGTYVHNDLINGVRYYYSAFSYDTTGHIVVTQKSAVPISATTVHDLRAASRDHSIILIWTNPTSGEFVNFSKVIVRASTVNYPQDQTEGDLVYEGTEEYLLHTSLTNGVRYYYTVWTVDTYGDIIEPGVNVTEIPLPVFAPVGNLVINDGDLLTYSTLVDLDVEIINEEDYPATEMMISNYSDFRNAVWESYARKKEWSFVYSEGIKYVYLKLKDSFGNISEATSSSIELKLEWINRVNDTKSAVKGLSERSLFGVGVQAVSNNGIGVWADGIEGDMLLAKRRIKTLDGSGQIIVDGRIISKYRYYAP